ncbi:aldo/keto reductase [Colwellia sp. E2M01]|uniref:aldo/keto reductase n=1 Tax=Colwellia sp. E2M01 TaxID=2841561 RepID=UPI001C0941C1|nr:aldo/keto reductase [Colwellia sp. E2M01]MBU2869962.1 aldo/keto reductase [Colwellia sp. E2M01]
MELALGTVQFGLDYGISNQQGQVPKSEVAQILLHAKSLGINTLDCAGAYGNSEKVLGELQESEHFNLVSKIPALTPQQISILPFFEQSLVDLNRNKLDTLLFHQADNLLNHPNKEQIFSEISQLKAQNLVKRIGISVYSPEQLKAISKQFTLDIVQAPINIFDQRFISTDMLSLYQKSSLLIHARSLFLQGLLLIEAEKLPPYFYPFKEELSAFDKLAKYLSCSKLTLALSVLAQDSHNKCIPINSVIDKIVVGVCNTEQLIEMVNAYQQAKKLSISIEEINLLADNRLELINPSLWQVE